MYNAHRAHDGGDAHVHAPRGLDENARGHDNHTCNVLHAHDDVQLLPSTLLLNPLPFQLFLISAFHQAHPKELL